MTDNVLLQTRDLTKSFGHFTANDHVDITILKGEIHALLGENGAGKSTFVKMIYGSLQPDQGQIFWDGKAHKILNPAYARKLGIAMVFQHFSLFEALNVAENIALALECHPDDKNLHDNIIDISKRYGLAVEPDILIADLSVGQRQRVEIVRCLLQNPKLLIMDEPTSVLTPQEADQLFVVLKRLVKEGCSVLYISHRLEEVRAICNRATILRHAKKIDEIDPKKSTARELANMMVGQNINVIKRRNQAPQNTKDHASGTSSPIESNIKIDSNVKNRPKSLALNDVSVDQKGLFDVCLQHISLDVYPGDIVAIAGIAGNGQSELFDVISGERLLDDNEKIKMNDHFVGKMDITKRRQIGASFVPEERLGHGAVPSLSLSQNVLLTRHGIDKDLVRFQLINRKKTLEMSAHIINTYDVRTPNDDPLAQMLSGGNLQKFVIGRELDRNPSLLVVNQPSWGVDAGAATRIRQALIDLADSGSGVLVISQDLDEIFEIANYVCVLSRGTLSPRQSITSLTREKVGLLMGGAH
ncbi:MAG: ABC transporter ATP-binding protein [Pseudomonadota bacterium]